MSTEPNACDCEKSDVEVIQNMENMWYWDCYVKCYGCGKATEVFEHRNDHGQLDQNSGTPKAIEAWNNKIFRGPYKDEALFTEILTLIDKVDNFWNEFPRKVSVAEPGYEEMKQYIKTAREKIIELRDL